MNTLRLDEMSVEDKLQVMEALWEDLSRHPEDIPVPEWHGQILQEREAARARGEDALEDWEQAKRRIRDEVS